MQETSALYQELLASNHKMETRLAIGETGVLITKQGDAITFGGVSILTGASGADGGYDEKIICEDGMTIERRMFSGDMPTVGDCISAKIVIKMHKPFGAIPEMARIVPYVRLKSQDEKRHSEWIQKGVFYIDTREDKDDGSPIKKIIITGYDDMLKAEQDYPSSTLSWSAQDIDVVREIAAFLGVSVDARTVPIINRGYRINYPAGYSCRDTLGYIAAMYAGSFMMSDLGELRLITIHGIPRESRYLIEATGSAITFGGDRILV